MANFTEVGPRTPVTEAIRVDKVSPRARLLRTIRALVIVVLAIILLIPVFAMGITAFKTRADVVHVPPKVIFKPTLEGFVFLLTDRALMNPTVLAEFQEAAKAGKLGLFERIALASGYEITGPSDYVFRLRNSLIIAGISTVTSVVFGLFAAYAFSRFNIAGKDDLLFFILSTRMLPAVVVTVPLFLM
jgi:multiple sugar transport system permease protein